MIAGVVSFGEYPKLPSDEKNTADAYPVSFLDSISPQ